MFLSRETVIKKNFLVSQVLFRIRFYTVLTERKGITGYLKYFYFCTTIQVAIVFIAKENFRGGGRPGVSKHTSIITSMLSVIRQKGESQNGYFKKTSKPNFRKANISYPLIRTCMYTYQRVRNVCFFFS